jgi:hypothetical protein
MATLTATALLAGGDTTFTVAIPRDVLAPADPDVGAGDADGSDPSEPATVVLRPLQVRDLQRIAKAAPDSSELSSVLMVHQALVEPSLSVDQVARMHAGLVEFLLAEVNRISGLHLGDGELAEAVHAPMARACFTLSREFGWTPDECAQLTIGQVLLYLEMLKTGGGPWSSPTD